MITSALECAGCEASLPVGSPRQRRYCDDCRVEKKRVREAVYYQVNKEAIRRRADPEKRRNWDLQKRYGITVEGYDRLYDEQEGRCAACQNERTLIVDHDHETSVVRGLLCQSCNLALGTCEDDPARLESLINYLALGQEQSAPKGL